jgi:hypothetical protein
MQVGMPRTTSIYHENCNKKYMGLAIRHRIIEIGTEISMCLNLELNALTNERYRKDFGRIIFHTEDVDKLYSYMKGNHNILNIVSFENEHQVLHGAKDIFIYVNLMDISFHLQHQ